MYVVLITILYLYNSKMVRKKQTISPEHVEVLQKWKERGFVDPDFVYEKLTDHYIGQLLKVAKNLSDEIYVEGHKGEKVRMYKETTVMKNKEQTITSKCLLLQSGQNNYSEHVRQHLLQKYSSKTVMPTLKVDPLSSFQSVLFCLDNVPVTYGKEKLKDESRITGNTAREMCNRIESSCTKDNTLL